MLTVSQYQRGLAHYYGCYKGRIDGKDGPATKKAVKKFQKLRGLKQDGKYGPKTNAELVAVVKLIQAIVGVKQDGVCGLLPWQPSKQNRRHGAWCRMESAVRNSGVDITVTEHPRLPAGPAHISAKRNLNVNAAADIATAIRPETLLQNC